jgi:hypothetical protein
MDFRRTSSSTSGRKSFAHSNERRSTILTISGDTDRPALRSAMSGSTWPAQDRLGDSLVTRSMNEKSDEQAA